MGFFVLIFLIATLGLPAGILYLIVEVLLSYTNDKATREKIKNAIPRFQDNQTGNASPSFPDLQRTVGGKMSGQPDKSKTAKTGTAAQGQKKTQTKAASNTTPSYTYTSNGTQARDYSGSTTKKQNAWQRQFNKNEPYMRPIKRRNTGRLATVGAVTLFSISGVMLLMASTDVLRGIAENPASFELIQYVDDIPMLLISIICLITGIWLIYSRKHKADRENRYIAIINQGYGMIPIDNICYLFPEKYDRCVNELQEMINKGTLPDAYIDYGRRLLVIDPKNTSIEPLIQQNGASIGAAGEPGKASSGRSGSKGKKKISEQKVDFLSLERLSKQVKDEDIKLKLIRISSTLKTIGQKAEEDPEIRTAAGVDTFMDMYLPKTIKLVEDYEEVNSMTGMPQDNELKQNILDTLDAIDDASMTLWKDIIHSDMIDISAELDALQTKLILDGYKKSELEPDGTHSEFTFDNMDISEEQPVKPTEHARNAADEEAKRKAEEAKRKAEAEAKRKAEAEAAARREKEEAEEAKRRAEAEEAKRKAEAEAAARQAEVDAENAARQAEEKDAAMEADLFSQLRAQQQKEKEPIK